MFRNYLLVAIRNLLRNKVHSFITITGLTLGMAGAALLLLNIQYELSVDQFHEKKERIYKVLNQATMDGHTVHFDMTAPPLGPALIEEYPEIKSMTRISNANNLFSYAGKRLQSGGLSADPAFLTMFSFPLVKGNAQTALRDKHAVVITQKLAKKLFGTVDPMNKLIRADNKKDFVVTGVLKELPENTKFDFEYLLPWSDNGTNWDHLYVNVFVELRNGANVQALNSKIKNIISKNTTNEMRAKLFLHPLSQLNLYTRFENGKPAGGNIDELRMLGILAGIILLIGCINFMNLSTARSEKRAREVGVRKVMGAVKIALIAQFIIESIMLAAIAGVIAFVLVQLVWPAFSVLAKVHMANVPWQSPYFWLAAMGLVVFTGLLAGSYPAFYLSSFKPVRVLKGVLKNGKALVTPRRILVVTQFVVAVFLINYTIIFQKQINHGQNRSLGFVKENLLYHSMTDDLYKNYDLVKNELIGSGTAVSICASSSPITRVVTGLSGLSWDGTNGKQPVNFDLINATGGFVKTHGLTLLAGRDIDIAGFPSDTAACLINEAAVKVMGLNNPVGKIIKDDNDNWTIVGVVKDVIIGNVNDDMKPLLVRGHKRVGAISIRLAGHEPSHQSITRVQQIIKKYNPNFVTDIKFADDDYAVKFKQAKNTATLLNSFSLIAIVIACLGLFGLATYMTENRNREIGIRKVLGASVTGVTVLLTKDFIKLVGLSIVIGSPLAWWMMHSYLQKFAYRTDISWWVPVAAGALVLLIAFCTVSIQTIRAAMANPADSLRTE
jgi:putative ABC transport system permease protein